MIRTIPPNRVGFPVELLPEVAIHFDVRMNTGECLSIV
jgi:hypothetical protein